MRDDFAVLILSHGRPDRIYTLKALKKYGYTGKWYIVCDDEDEKLEEYKRVYKDKVIVFSKKELEGKFDIGDNLTGRNVVVFARNKVFDIARELGLRYFLELDDDYVNFSWRWLIKGKAVSKKIKNLDRVFELMIDFLEKTGSLTVAFAQGGDYIGGRKNELLIRGWKRKAMNTFFCSVERPFYFLGRINEDTTMYVFYGMRGKKIFTIGNVYIDQKPTQTNPGGLTDIYLDLGTYVKSFYTLMWAPSCVKIALMGNKYKRLHHKILWDYCVPKIVSEELKKVGGEKCHENLN